METILSEKVQTLQKHVEELEANMVAERDEFDAAMKREHSLQMEALKNKSVTCL